jgi:hypothetical protein
MIKKENKIKLFRNFILYILFSIMYINTQNDEIMRNQTQTMFNNTIKIMSDEQQFNILSLLGEAGIIKKSTDQEYYTSSDSLREIDNMLNESTYCYTSQELTEKKEKRYQLYQLLKIEGVQPQLKELFKKKFDKKISGTQETKNRLVIEQDDKKILETQEITVTEQCKRIYRYLLRIETFDTYNTILEEFFAKHLNFQDIDLENIKKTSLPNLFKIIKDENCNVLTQSIRLEQYQKYFSCLSKKEQEIKNFTLEDDFYKFKNKINYFYEIFRSNNFDKDQYSKEDREIEKIYTKWLSDLLITLKNQDKITEDYKKKDEEDENKDKNIITEEKQVEAEIIKKKKDKNVFIFLILVIIVFICFYFLYISLNSRKLLDKTNNENIEENFENKIRK